METARDSRFPKDLSCVSDDLMDFSPFWRGLKGARRVERRTGGLNRSGLIRREWNSQAQRLGSSGPPCQASPAGRGSLHKAISRRVPSVHSGLCGRSVRCPKEIKNWLKLAHSFE